MKILFFGALAALFAASLATAPARAAASASTRAASTAHNAVQLRASLDAKSYTPGAPIQLFLTATNTSKSPVKLSFSSGQRFDFSLFRANAKTPVYTWSAARMFIQVLGSVTIPANGSRTFDAILGDEMGTLSPGKYRLEARLANAGTPIKAPPIFFEVKNLQLAFSARVASPRYKIGAPIPIEMTAKNLARKTNVVPFGSGLTYDIIITDQNGNVVWTYGANLRFIRALGSVTWRASETKNFSATWNGAPLPRETAPTNLEPGRYKIQAILASTPQVFAPPIYVYLTN